MSDIIVVGVDGTRTSILGLREAIWLAESLGAELHIVNVVKARDEEEVRLAATVLENVLEGVTSTAPIVPAVTVGGPAEALIAYADEVGARILVAGNRQMKGVGRVLGSVGAQLARDANCAVYIPRTVEMVDEESANT
ncbi:MAG: universal stress protein [Actinomycetota bacterium]